MKRSNEEEHSSEFPPKKNILLSNMNSNNLSKSAKHTQNNSSIHMNGNSNGNSEAFKSKRQNLPIFKDRNFILSHLKKNDTVILYGETGSGKTTQLPQYLYEEYMLKKGAVVISQPRRVAAMTIAERVSKEMGKPLGDLVGYSVRFDDMTSPQTKIKFATDGMILREAMIDPTLNDYSWVILDEAHERTVNTDILFGIVKKAQRERKESKRPLKVIVMSATIDAKKLSEYFDDCAALICDGREHKLWVHHISERTDDYRISCIQTIMKVHKEYPNNHGILVFLTGQEEIDKMSEHLRKALRNVDKNIYPPMKVSRLYAALPKDSQLEALKPPPQEMRHCILSTNIAETSVTIPGVKIVIDSGRAKIRTYDPKKGIYTLKVRQISQAQARQRHGRAGRESEGRVYCTYTRKQFTEMVSWPTPEIRDSSLAGIVLQLLSVGVKNVFSFDFLDKPPRENLEVAVEELILLEAIEKIDKDNVQLTDLGKKMSAFPLEPRYSKIILMSPKYKCTAEILTVIALLSSEQVYVIPTTGKQRVQALDAHQKIRTNEGDHLSLVKTYQKFNASNRNKNWCTSNFLHYRNLSHAASIRKQLSSLCQRQEIPLVSCGDQKDSVLRCLLTGLFTQVAELQSKNVWRTISTRQDVKIHPSSVVFQTNPAYVIFDEIINTGTVSYLHGVSPVQPIWLYETAPGYFRTRTLSRANNSLAVRDFLSKESS